MSLHQALSGADLYPAHGLAALVRLLQDDGMSAGEALHGTGLDADGLADRLIGGEQYARVCRNALEASPDPGLAFRLGARLRPTDCGVLGLLLMSCASLRDCFGLLAKYQQLALWVLAGEPVETDQSLRWTLAGGAALPLPQALVLFLTELQVSQQLAWVQEVLGEPACRLGLVRLAYPAPAHRALYERHLGCPLVFNAGQTEVHYPRPWLQQRPRLANAQTAVLLQSACEDLLSQIDVSAGMAGQVYRTLVHLRDPGAGMKAVAAALKMTDRTLRRRLADEGTSFTAISCRVRVGVATQHLRASRASIEQIAEVAGFSDPSNFRRAFVRWTSMSPAQFRRLQHP